MGRRPRTLILIFSIFFLLSACGQTGVEKLSDTPSPTTVPTALSPSPEAPAPDTLPFNPLPPDSDLPAGEISGFQDRYGPYFLYRPTQLSDPPQTLVVIHGTPAVDQSAGETAFYYAENWAPFAEENGWLLLVPAFNQADFSSRKGEITDALTGYRGLFGRQIPADDWVIRLLGLGRDALGLSEAPILIYGHSAGGQYVGRFLVAHPELVERAVISAAVTYPQPDPALSWP